jgi:hypothetical protein
MYLTSASRRYANCVLPPTGVWHGVAANQWTWEGTRCATVAACIFAVILALAIGISWYELVILTNAVLTTLVLLKLFQDRRVSDLEQSIHAIARDADLHPSCTRIISQLARATAIGDPVHREMVLDVAGGTALSLENATLGEFVFVSNEQWRKFYSKLLTDRSLHLYRSVAIVQGQSYWNSEAGLNSTQLNLRESEAGRIRIKRIVILTSNVWPNKNELPRGQIQEWLIEQHHRGIALWLVHESEVAGEPDLLVDMGIYGSRAIGIQELNDDGGTRRFRLQFGFEHVEAAEERWQRLLVYAVKYSDFLDRYTVSS